MDHAGAGTLPVAHGDMMTKGLGRLEIVKFMKVLCLVYLEGRSSELPESSFVQRQRG